MPELPEVETMRRGVAPAIGGIVRAAELVASRYRPIKVFPDFGEWPGLLCGQPLRDVLRLGKRVVLAIGERFVVLEPRMAGLVTLHETPTTEHVRLRFEVKKGRTTHRIVFWDRRGLGVAQLLDAVGYQALKQSGRVGPDALDATEDDWKTAYARSKRPIKVALLDQTGLAGIGNLYASEILHLIKMHPATPCDRLHARDWSALRLATIQVLGDAIENEGSTLRDGTYRAKLNEPGRYQNRHLVYDRKGEPCLTCGSGRIERVVQAQRSTFFCPQCQRRGRQVRAV